MVKYYMRGTRLEQSEALMMTVPRFRSRGGGYKKPVHHYSAEDADCKYCMYYRTKSGCTKNRCPFIDERIEANAITYGELLKALQNEGPHQKFCERINQITRGRTRCQFVNQMHLHRMRQCISRLRCGSEPIEKKWLGLAFLLTSSDSIWEALRDDLSLTKVNWARVHINEANLEDYVILQMAKTLWDEHPRIAETELADPQLVSDERLSVIVDAVMISTYGDIPMLLGGIL